MLWLLNVCQRIQGALKPGRGAGASGGARPRSACDEGAVAGAAMALAASGAIDISRVPLTGRPPPRRAPASAPLDVALCSRTASCSEGRSVLAQHTDLVRQSSSQACANAQQLPTGGATHERHSSAG